MAVHRFAPTEFHNTIGAHAPALSVAEGDTVITQTLDAHGFDRDGHQPGIDPNPMTGPFYVEGAEPGDALAIRIERIAMTRATGWTRQGLAHGVVDAAAVPHLPARDKIDWVIDANSGSCRLKTRDGRLADWSVPIEPMIGCLGVAPEQSQAISTATSGRHGGNMDYRRIGAGSEISFPVSVAGALFFLGDVHAAQGDGEIAGTGIETAAEVQFTVRVAKGRAIGWPRGETGDAIFCIGNARPLDQALQHATTEMLSLLMDDHGLSAIEAGHLMAMTVRYDIANVFNPAYSVACRIDKVWLRDFDQ